MITRFVFLLGLIVGTAGSALGDVIDVPAGQHQLFLDDQVIDRIENLNRILHQPQKRGAMIRAANPTETIQTRTAPIWNPAINKYMLWVMSTGQSLRLSEDGLHWTTGINPNIRIDHAVFDPLDTDPARRFKAALLNEGFAVSADGIQWSKLDVAAIPSSDEGNFSYDPKQGLFIHSVKRSGPFGRSVAIATSRDFKSWQDYGLVFQTDEQDQEIGRQRIAERLANKSLKQTEYNSPEHYSVQIYNMGVFHYEGLYIGLPSVYHHTGKVPPGWSGFEKKKLSPAIRDAVGKYGDYTGFYNIQVACSRDLKNWHRVADRSPFIEASPLGAGAYDTQTIIGPSAPVVHEDELWFYYTGVKHYAFVASGIDPQYDDYYPDKGGICLAVLRKDGFVSLDAGDTVGTLVTKPFTVNDTSLHINAEAKTGRVDVTILDEAGEKVATAEPVSSDRTDSVIQWKTGKLDQKKGKPVTIRFELKNARLYSFWLE